MQLISTATPLDGQTFRPKHAAEYPTGLVQAVVPSGATLVISMRVTPDAPWVAVESFTANGIKAIAVANEIKAEVTGTFSGDAKAWLQTRE